MTEQVGRTAPGSECRSTRLRPGGSWHCPGVWQLLESCDPDEDARRGTPGLKRSPGVGTGDRQRVSQGSSDPGPL